MSAPCQKRTHAVQHVLADPSSRSQGGATYFCPAASRISAVIMSGCDMRERWLAFTSIIFAPMRLAMKRWRSGLIVRSSVEKCRLRADFVAEAWPGDTFEFKVTAKPGERLTIATMFAQSNDLFYAPKEEGIALFDASGKPVAGDITSQILLWDAGTEVNEEPGLGPNQAPLQPAPNTGPAEHGVGAPSDHHARPDAEALNRSPACGAGGRFAPSLPTTNELTE